MDSSEGSEESDEPDQQEKNEQSNWTLIRRLLLLSWCYRWGCLRVLGLQFTLLVFAISGLGLTGLGIDFIRHQVNTEAKPPDWPFGIMPPGDWTPIQVVMAISAGILLFALGRGSLQYLFHVETARLVQGKIVVNLRSQIYDKLQRLSFRFFDENESGSIINRVTRDVQATRMFIDLIMMQGLTMVISLGLFLVYMLRIHVPLTLACLATTPALIWLAIRFSRVVKPAYRKNRDLVDNLVLVLSENIQGVRVIKGFARESLVFKRFQKANDRLRKQIFWVFQRVSTYGPSIHFMTQINLVVLLGYGGYLVVQGKIMLGGGLVVFSGLLQQFANQINVLVQLTNRVQDCLSAARRVFEVLDAPVEIVSKPDAKPLETKAPCTVEFDHVTFGYGNDEPVLEDISFRADAGECIAILGATGSGKSTLMSLIPRFYDPREGAVRINGIDVRDYRLEDVRRSTGIVFQENFLFSNRVASNIAFGHHGATDAQIEKAAKVAAAHGFIMEMPMGYDTILGEGGGDISGGQRQRIAIARAILLEPTILLLDDPTAAIDAQTEHEIMDAMENAMRGRTTFIVAHRLSTLKRADRIIVLEKGRIVQIGTHEKLITDDGPYRTMVKLQVVDGDSKRVLRDQGVDVPEEEVSV